MIRRLDENDPINISVGDAIKALWTDPGRIQHFYSELLFLKIFFIRFCFGFPFLDFFIILIVF